LKRFRSFRELTAGLIIPRSADRGHIEAASVLAGIPPADNSFRDQLIAATLKPRADEATRTDG